MKTTTWKKRSLSLLLALLLAVGLLPTGVLAEDAGIPASVTVSLRAQKENRFLLNTQELVVTDGLAEQYGYTVAAEDHNKVAVEGPTVFDALVAAHAALYGEAFTADTAKEYLNISSSGYLSTAFGQSATSTSFFVNGEMPNDGIQGSYGTTGYMADTARLKDGDEIEFWFYQDAYWSDYYTSFDQDAVTVTVGNAVTLTLQGFMAMSAMGYTPEVIPISGPITLHTVNEDGTLSAALTGGEGAELTPDANGQVTLTFDTVGTYVVTAQGAVEDEYMGECSIVMPVCTVTVLPDACITVPGDAALFVGSKAKHYVPFTEIQPAARVDNGDGTVSYYFELANNSTYNYRISGEGCLTTAGSFRKTAGYTLTVTEADLKPEDKTAATLDRNVASNSGYNVADVYLNINAQGHLRLGAVGDTYQLVNLRSWEAVDTITNNYFIEPDYHYTVLDENGTASGSVVTVSGSGLVTAKGEGTAIVLVTYDAMNVNSATGGPFFGAIWPENTGVFVVSVGAGDSGIDTGMTLNAGKNSTDAKLAGDAIDAEHDVIYFTGEQGSYTFTPGTAGVAVSVANPTVTETAMAFSGFQPVPAGADGSFTVPLAEGRNIVKLTKDGESAYQVITAKKVSYTVNGQAAESLEGLAPGDTVSIVFDTLYHPANKLAGVYNMSAVAMYTDVDGYAGQLVGGTSNQYKFASTAAAQTVSNLLTRKATGWSPSYQKSGQLTIPADWAEDTFTLSGGALVAIGFGDPYGNHRAITLEAGKDPNFSASVREAYLGQLPDITIPVTLDKTVTGIEITTPPTKTTYYEGDSFDPSGMVVAATYSDGSKNENVTSYTLSPAVLTADTKEVTVTYGGQTAAVPVTVTQPRVTAIAVTTPPAKTSYIAGDVFDPTGMVVTAAYENGSEAPTTSYTYEPKRELTTTDTAMTVIYTGGDAIDGIAAVTQAITVAASSGGTEQPDPSTVTVTFTLLGDTLHGDPTAATGTHTLRDGNLEPWLTAVSVTVPSGSTVLTVITRALGLAGIPYENPTGNYITTIRGLGEFDNGQLSGWMYTLNGTHPDLGVAEQTVRSGDVIVLHYTDDYTREEGSEDWGGSGTGGAEETPEEIVETGGGAVTIVPEATVNSQGEATAAVSAAAVEEALSQAAEDSSISAIVVAPEIAGDPSKVTVELPKTAVSAIASGSELDLTISTPIAVMTLTNAGLAELAAQSGSTVSFSAEAVTVTGADGTQAGAVKVEVSVGGSSVKTVAGGITVTIPGGETEPGNVLVMVNADGTETILKKSIVNGDGSHTAILPGSATVRIVDNSKEFSDVADGHWASAAIDFAAARELFHGTSGTTFSPEDAMTRAMLVTVLYRLEDAVAEGGNTFADVAEHHWCNDAVTWARGSGIVYGVGGNLFAPDRSITRQELVTMLYRYAGFLGMDTAAAGELSRYSDSGEIDAYAQQAMAWAVGTGLIKGRTSTTLAPTDAATRAEVATVLQRLIANMVQ